ncbi:endophilin-B2 isoform X8 [Vulpes vulpes]|uniref:Endophilin-B2 n=2 Tax=Canidae TaxID=9608 RepID=A0A8C0RE39_CANLF|nr:endophilin-B2 isoform X7 [Canis lupus dingo]XP_025865263.1 endophilin-B2 isoform X7 [Vulpes vulpes]XP_038405056.1 endophilin-B2 isoform X6 [Canis lupus familiaris]XP_038534302.1 endophilin-B2 isoform X6 [Canis lupus familiaris]XP_041581726.1 endophilin-B2 isoform X5 [Vulpes lagopus]XP_861239.2 endophilin-B2 isoform X6 [Canis lupus familiaris]|eukprot:XP_861239.2 endophilin-B2 isoform X6 [Canis lupus familiaris]
MDFNMKKLASDAGIFFTRAVQFTEEKFGQAEKTELDAHFENLLARADSTKNWTEKILRQTEVLLQPNPSARVEEFLYEKLDRKVPSRVTNGELLAQYMAEAASELGPTTPYGKTLIKVAEAEKRLGAAERDFIHTASINFLTPLRNFLEGDWKTISKERRLLQNRRLDLDACKARLKKAKAAEAKATTVPDFQETRPRNYILSASASALWNDEVDKAEQELRVAQTEFDRQAEVTRLLLEGISSTHVNHLRCLHEFVESQTTYYAQCYRHMLDLQKQLGRFPGTFVGTTEPVSPPLSSTSPTTAVATMPVGPSVAGLAPPGEAALRLEVTPPASGTRKARVLYDYEAADSSELALLADELITVYSLPGMDPDWLIGERGNKKGKVPVTYLELLS